MNYELVFQKIIADPRYAEGITYGKPRKGHQEGVVRAHLAELDSNLRRIWDMLAFDELWKLSILIHTHDTFKKWSARDVPIDQLNSHASLARNFLAEFLTEGNPEHQDLLAMVQWHDENFALWKQMKKTGDYDHERLLKRVVEGIHDIELFLMFTLIDGHTQSKMALADQEKPEKIRWFYEQVASYRGTMPRFEMAMEMFGL